MTDLIRQLNAKKVADDRCGLRQNATIDLCIKLVEDYAKINYAESNYPIQERSYEEWGGER